MTEQFKPDVMSGDIAIVGMAVNVPGAPTLEAYWKNLRGGVESIIRLDDDTLKAAGESPELMRRENYVPVAAVLEGFETFDADFFGFSPKEAAILDPQHRKFLETSWEALENAGHTPDEFAGKIGVFAGCGMGSYFYFNICSNRDLVDDVGMFLLRHTGNDKDFLSTRVSHVFDLRGPSVNVQTACSTSLVAIHYAADALRAGECDMALAGGVTIELPQRRGYLYKENEILSPDGHCHAFDHRAKGTVFGSGSGTVALRRLEDALADGDHIWAVIKGSSLNNDGAAKAGYLAPSESGQAANVVKALAAAGVPAETIGYVECHGTGTYLGDPIEVAAMTEGFRTNGAAGNQYCGLGSVKTNIGHLDTAAGVAGLIKTTLALSHAEIPPSLGYEAPNPVIDFETSPFFVNDKLRPWAAVAGSTSRRAMVNALGVGGTNAHVVLEEAPAVRESEESDFPFQPIMVSARSKKALEANTAALAAHLRAHPEQSLADVAYTLKQGRKGFEKRRVVVASSHEEAADMLESGDTRQVFTHDWLGSSPDVVFMFPGGGAQYPGMGHDLYETEPVFAEWMDRGLDHLQAQLDYDIRALWLPKPENRDAAAEQLKRPSAQLPLLMIVEYALAQLWMSWGVRPAALIGHSMGENTAAALAGVMSFEDCIDLVLLRGRLFDTVPEGGMISVAASKETVAGIIGDTLDLGAANAPELCMVSGPNAKLDALAADLDARGIEWQRILINIAAHSRMLEPILADFGAFLKKLDLKAPTMPIISNRTGAVMTAAQATDPDYWVGQLRNTVLFADGITTLAARSSRVFLEVGPGKALSSLAQMNPSVSPGQVLSSLRHPQQEIADDAYFFGVIGRLWACGVEADWDQFWGEAKRNRVMLPTYQFQRSSFFIEPGKPAVEAMAHEMVRRDDMAEWGWRPVWRPAYAACDIDVTNELSHAPAETWLVFEDGEGLAQTVCERLEGAGQTVVRVVSGDSFARVGDRRYTLAPELGREGYEALLAALADEGLVPGRIAHFWGVTGAETFRPGSSFFHRNMEHGFYSLTHLAQALGNADLPGPVHITAVTNGAASVNGGPLTYPEKATISGPAGVMGRELPGVSCATVDVELPMGAGARRLFGAREARDLSGLANRLLEDLFAAPSNDVIAYQGERRFQQVFRPIGLDAAEKPAFRDGGTYLITGGLGGIGLDVAQTLLDRHAANVVLVTRRTLPPREGWDRVLARSAPSDPTAAAIRAIRDLETLGGSVDIASADVVNLEDMRAVVDRARDRHGRIDGVIHAAGVIDDAPLLARDTAAIERVLAPKIDGLRVLDELFPDGSLDLMVLFSSTSTATRAAGQLDYVAANEYLNAWAKSRQGGETRVMAVNWGVWAQIGMAAKAIAEDNPADAPEVPVDAPLLDTAGFDPDGARLYRATWEAKQSWVLDQHRTADDSAVLPGTGYIELAAEALAEEGIDAPFEIRDLFFLRPFFAPDGVEQRATVRLAPKGAGWGFELMSAVTVDGRPALETHAQARLVSLDVKAPPPVGLASVAKRCGPATVADDGDRLRSPQEKHLHFGPAWHVLRETALGKGEGIARLALPEAMRGTLDGTVLHPGLMDLATGWAIELSPHYSAESLWVPMSYGTIRVFGPLTAELVSWVRVSPNAPAGTDMAAFDVTICAPDGRVLVEVGNFQMTKVAAGKGFVPPALAANDVVFTDVARPQTPRSAAEERLAYNVSQGIRPGEGVEALERALALRLPQVVVSSLDLEGLMADADRSEAAPVAAEQGFDRPDLDSDYVAPETVVEKELAAQWSKLLGVSQVGTDDDFFDLGGHSLIAVRLCASINRAYGTDFPISILAEAPTIREWAKRIEAQVGPREEGAEATAAAESRPTFTHVVTLNKSRHADATPFFLVAGMFGNVLNLRHLAHLVGEDRSVYGLQAKGLLGEDEPHRRVEDAAAALISEMRQVQPDGPYLVGGFSGGGITAFEIARQLEAAGEEVAQLVLLDTPMPVRPGLNRTDKALIKLAEFREKGPGYVAEWARNRVAWEIQKRQGGGEPEAAGAFHNLKIQAAFLEAVGAYQMTPWDGNLVLFRPKLDRHWKVSGGRYVNVEREYVIEDNGWTAWVPRTEVVEVPGDHDSMVLVPNVGVLATHLRRRLDAALNKTDSAGGWPAAEAAE